MKDRHAIPGEGGEPRFFADSMLGKLARWMRTIGFDVEYEKDIDDSRLVERAMEEGRIILTRDTLLIRRRVIRGRYIFIKSAFVGEQLREISAVFPIGYEMFLSRCIRCNALLEESSAEDVEDKVPAYVHDTQKKFMRCPLCRRVYWAGTHREKMLSDLSSLLGRG